MATQTTDFYSTLGVNETATQDEIKAAFRKLAKKYHPDRNKGSKSAESKFKEISEANETLSDPKKRSEYDMIRKYGHAGGPGFQEGQWQYEGDPRGGSRGHSFDFGSSGDGGQHQTFGGNLDDILEEMLGRTQRTSGRKGTRRRIQRGDDIELVFPVSFAEAALGATKTIKGKSTGKTLTVNIPAGIEDGEQVGLSGEGQHGLNGGERGDLVFHIRIMPDPNFERRGNDIYSKLEIDFREAILGTRKPVKTLRQTVSLSIPAGTQPGTQMRLKGQGIHARGITGDQYVEIAVHIPTKLTEKQKKMLEEWEG